MSLRYDFMPAATAPECQPPAAELDDERHPDLERRFWKNVCLQPPLYGADVEGTLFDKDLKVLTMLTIRLSSKPPPPPSISKMHNPRVLQPSLVPVVSRCGCGRRAGIYRNSRVCSAGPCRTTSSRFQASARPTCTLGCGAAFLPGASPRPSRPSEGLKEFRRILPWPLLRKLSSSETRVGGAVQAHGGHGSGERQLPALRCQQVLVLHTASAPVAVRAAGQGLAAGAVSSVPRVLPAQGAAGVAVCTRIIQHPRRAHGPAARRVRHQRAW